MKPKERLGLDLGRNLGANARGAARLVHNDESARAPDALDDGLDVPGEDGAQVDELDLGATGRFGHERRERGGWVREQREGRLAVVHRRAPREQRQVGAGHEDLRAREGKLKVVDRDLLDRGAVEDLGLHEDDRVWVAYRGEEQAFGLEGRARDDDLFCCFVVLSSTSAWPVVSGHGRTFSPDAPMKKPSGLCEWYSPPWPTVIVGVRTVRRPTLN